MYLSKDVNISITTDLLHCLLQYLLPLENWICLKREILLFAYNFILYLHFHLILYILSHLQQTREMCYLYLHHTFEKKLLIAN